MDADLGAELSASQPHRAPTLLEHGQIEQAADVVARALAGFEPWGAWALPDDAIRIATLRELVERDLRERFTVSGEVWTINGQAVAMWIPPSSSDPDGAFSSRRDSQAFSRYGDRAEFVAQSDDLISRLKPDEDHWYLDTLATDPTFFGQGLGGALLDHCLLHRDTSGDGLACALDTHTALNVEFYGRRGFEVIGHEMTPGGGPPLWVMSRPPGG